MGEEGVEIHVYEDCTNISGVGKLVTRCTCPEEEFVFMFIIALYAGSMVQTPSKRRRTGTLFLVILYFGPGEGRRGDVVFLFGTPKKRPLGLFLTSLRSAVHKSNH